MVELFLVKGVVQGVVSVDVIIFFYVNIDDVGIVFCFVFCVWVSDDINVVDLICWEVLQEVVEVLFVEWQVFVVYIYEYV